MKGLSLYITALAVFLAPCIHAQSKENPDTAKANTKTLLMSGFRNTTGLHIYDGSAAANLYRYKASYTEIGASYEMRDENRAILPQLGDRTDAGKFEAASWIRLDGRSAVYANVEYANGNSRNILWNSSSDFLLLYPYVTADTVGGNLAMEKYMFSGGYSRRDGRFSYGLNGSYRALHEYRQTDPRPRNITSDLKVSASAGYSIGGYLIEASADYRIYRQISNVSFYNPGGANTSEIPMTGLGTYYERFSGSGAYLGTYHRGSGYRISAGLIPEDGTGWLCNAGYGNMKVDRLLSNQNDVPITSISITEISFYTAYKTSEWGIYAQATISGRIGSEMVIDNGASDIYNVLGSMEMYGNNHIFLGAGAYMQRESGMFLWSIALHTGIETARAVYVYPERQMKYGHINIQVPASVSFIRKSWLFSFRGGLMAEIGCERSLRIDPACEEAAMSEMVREVFESLSCSAYGVSLTARVQRSIGGKKKMAIFADADYRITVFDTGRIYNGLQIKLGICF